MPKKIAFERHCGYWPLQKQVEMFAEQVEMFAEQGAPLPRGPDPLTPQELEALFEYHGPLGCLCSLCAVRFGT